MLLAMLLTIATGHNKSGCDTTLSRHLWLLFQVQQRKQTTKMEEIKTEPVDFVREFQEYLTQQTQHVNMISGSICGERETTEQFQAAAPRCEQTFLDPASVEVSLPAEDGSDTQVEGLERTCDGKYKCSYCSYANKGMARLIEHIRIHTGEKPHRCQLCPFASAYERHLEAHVRSHTGEKPYKCDLCAFRCSDRSNLSHHRRRRHKLLPTRVVRSPFSSKRMLSSLQKRTGSLGFGRRLLINLNPTSAVVPRSDYFNEFSHKVPQLNGREHKTPPKTDENESWSRISNGFRSSLDQLSLLAGHLSNANPDSRSPASPDRQSLKDEKPILAEQVRSDGMQTSPPKEESPTSGQKSSSFASGCGTETNATASSGSVSNSQASTPTPAASTPNEDGQNLLHRCKHCDIHFSDNIIYTIHMGCHGYEHPFQCNICGHMCMDKYNFACHFARGQHKIDASN
ncbi:zinc finger protein Pegasus [Fundulus heteroclitus]|uniref:zinc finger protein Pegasus n=1 Tax=Fundulus heteroclitus TaxID=8078 RepID=UPI00165C65C9|nr:zinc finger protein Pegasus [Fundulus heteroclitus]